MTARPGARGRDRADFWTSTSSDALEGLSHGDLVPLSILLLSNFPIPHELCEYMACLLDPEGTKTSWPWHLKLKPRRRGRPAKDVERIDLVQLAQLFLSNHPPPEARQQLAQLLDPEGTESEMPWRLQLMQKSAGNLRRSDNWVARESGIGTMVLARWTELKKERALENWESAVRDVAKTTGLSRAYVAECYSLMRDVFAQLKREGHQLGEEIANSVD